MKIFKCEVCGNVVDMLYSGGGTLVCCGQDMLEMVANQEETVFEKHLPALEINDNEIKVQVGEMLHPMEENHHIEWIALATDKIVIRKKLAKDSAPIVKFDMVNENYVIYAYCNIHGLFQGK